MSPIRSRPPPVTRGVNCQRGLFRGFTQQSLSKGRVPMCLPVSLIYPKVTISVQPETLRVRADCLGTAALYGNVVGQKEPILLDFGSLEDMRRVKRRACQKTGGGALLMR